MFLEFGLCSSHVTFDSEEDVYGSYARILCKYFLAEGIVSQHAVHVSSADRSPAGILRVSGSMARRS